MGDAGPVRYCKSCGGELPGDARFCAHCGAVQDTVDDSPLRQPDPSDAHLGGSAVGVSGSSKRTGVMVVVGVVVVAVLVGVVAVVVSSVSGGGSPDSDDASAVSTTAVGAASSSSSSSMAPTSTTTVDPLSVALAEMMDLVGNAPELVVAPGLLDGVDLDAGLPDGAVVTPVKDMLLVSGDTAEVLVDVVLPDGRTDQFVMVLVNDGERWLVAYTVLVS